MKIIFYALLSLLLFVNNSKACTYTLELEDSYGDGWNGASLDLLVNGTNSGNYDIASGSSASYTFTFNPNDDISFNFNSGSWDSECSWTILDENGDVVCSGNGGSYSNPVCSFATNGCDAIPPPPTDEDCLGAIPLCQDVYYNGSGSFGTGNYSNEINVGASECIVQELGGNWYTFTPQNTGTLNFVITPDNAAGEDYDWAVFDLTNASCADLTTGDPYNYMISANAAGDDGSTPPANQGPTGISGANAVPGADDCVGPGTGNWNTYNPDVTVQQGNTYVLYIAQFNGSQGYTVDFSSSQASLYDNTPPTIVSIDTPIVCGATSITFHFSENILCNTVDDADFYLTGPGGPYTVSNVTSSLCASGADHDNYLTADISPAITQSGNYTIGLDANAAGSITDMCGNVAPSTSFNFEIENIVLTLSQVNIDCAGNDNGSITATITPAGTSTYTYSWSNSSTTGPTSDLTNTISSLPIGTYSVTVVDAGGCSVTDQVTITDNPNPTPSITGVLSICSGMATTLDAGAGYANYSWNPAGSSQTFSATAAGNYSVTVTDANGCMGTDMVTVTENSSLTPTITGTLAICDGASTVLDAGSSYATYDWSTSESTQTITVTAAGTYSVTVSDVNGCSGTDQVTVTTQGITVEITGILGMCDGETTIIDAGAGFDNYLWSTGATTQTLNVAYSGIYSVTVSDNLGCSSTDAVTITADPLNLVVSSDKLICKDASADLAAALSSGGTPPFSYHWSNGETTSNINVSPNTETTYTVYISDAAGCFSDTGTVSVSIQPDVSYSISANKDTVCPGDPVMITSMPISGTPPYNITDSNNDFVNIDNIEYPYQQQTYIYTVTDACGSTASDMVTINTHPIPPLNIQADVLNGCAPLSVNFFTSQDNDNYEYTWNFESGSIGEVAMGANVRHIFEHYGLYDVSVSVVSDKGCKNSLKVNELIDVYRNPEAKFITNPQTVSIIDPQINFTNLSQWADTYIWSFGDGDSSNIVNPYHKYNNIDAYTVRLVSITKEGCVDSVLQQIVVENEPTIYVPSAFSPDGDNINDLFVVQANGIDLDNYNLKIYDRWGEIIFESNDLYDSWDGKAKGLDRFVQSGTYIWILVVNYENGIEYEKSGTVTVIR